MYLLNVHIIGMHYDRNFCIYFSNLDLVFVLKFHQFLKFGIFIFISIN